MTREQAIKKLRKVLGPKAYWRVGEKVSRAEERVEAMVRYAELHIQNEALRIAKDARREALLVGDAEYQRLKAEYIAGVEERKRVGYTAYYHRFTVGTAEGIAGIQFGHQRAQGDTWEEVFNQLETKKRDVA